MKLGNRQGATPQPFSAALEFAEDVSVREGHTFVRARLVGNVVRDISRQHWPLRQAQRRVEELAAANRRKDEFLAMLSHELRSPLASIAYAVRILEKQDAGASAPTPVLALMDRQLRRMTRLVDELLDVSRVANGRLRLQRARIDLVRVVRNSIETLEPDIRQRNHRLSVALPDAPVWLQGDADRLEQVFVNLLANASKYTDAGGDLTVWIHTNERHAVVRVRDSGIGIAPDALPHVFDLSARLTRRSRVHSGLGIGLAVVRSLVQAARRHRDGGRARVRAGSEFTVRLPTES
jgi:signal transduction histidine kinase